MRFDLDVLALLGALAAVPHDAHAASCCGTGHGLGQRLGPGETAALSVSARVADRVGSYDPEGRFFTIPSRSFDGDARVDLSALFAPTSRLQVAVTAPVVLNFKQLGAERDVGGGLGDLTISGRFDVFPVSTARFWPAMAITTSALLPTGRSAKDAHQLLAADATGLGVAEIRPGVFLEQSFGGKVSAIVSASVGFRSEANEPPAPRIALQPRWRVVAAVGPVFHSGLSLSFGGIFEYEGAPKIQGMVTPDAQRHRTAFLGFVGYDLSTRFTVLGSVEIDLPMRYFGKNEAALAAFSIGVRRSFFWEK